MLEIGFLSSVPEHISALSTLAAPKCAELMHQAIDTGIGQTLELPVTLKKMPPALAGTIMWGSFIAIGIVSGIKFRRGKK
jgi:hypothetical protein